MNLEKENNAIETPVYLSQADSIRKNIEDIPGSDYDSAWKDVIEKLFEPFLTQFFPQIALEIDFSKPVEFLGLEFRPITSDSSQGKRIADVVAKVHLRENPGTCILVYAHIEVHGDDDTGVFMGRMFVYHYRVYDKFKAEGVEIVSLAILTDESPTIKLKEFKESRWGFELTMKVPFVRLSDYKYVPEKIEELKNSKNPMAMVIRAQLKSYDVKHGTNDQKYSAKRELMLGCLNAGWSKEEIRILFKFIDWIITLPKELQQQLKQEIIKAEEVRNMNYIPTYEREAFYEGRTEGKIEGKIEGKLEGKIEGKLEGIKEGKLEGKKETARELVKLGIDIPKISQATGLPIKEIEMLTVAVQ